MLRKEEILERTSNGLSVFKHYVPGNWRIGRNFLNRFMKIIKRPVTSISTAEVVSIK